MLARTLAIIVNKNLVRNCTKFSALIVVIHRDPRSSQRRRPEFHGLDQLGYAELCRS